VAGTAAAAGAAALRSLPALAASPAPSGNGGASSQSPRQSSAPKVSAPATAGTSYANFSGYDFKPISSTTTYNFVLSSSITVSGGYPALHVRVPVPLGGVLTEAYFMILRTDTNPDDLELNYVQPFTQTYSGISAATGTQSASPQKVDFAFSPFVVDNAQTTIQLFYFPGAFTTAHQLYGARVGWILNPGLVTFPSGHRVFDGYTTPVSNGNVYGPINALTEVTTSGWTGQPTGVPAGAKAAFCAVQAYSPGVLTLFPDGAADPGGANYAGTGPAGQLNLLYQLVPLSTAGKFKIHAYFNGQVFVDVWGYQV